MRKLNNNPNDYNFSISGSLTGPDFLLMIGDETEPLDLKLGPLSAVNTYYKILKQITYLTKEAFTGAKSKRVDTRLVLRDFYINMQYLMKAGVQKSIGDYGQEFTALSKFGATTRTIYDENNLFTDGSGSFKTIPYNDNGNALRVMIANDRPSAYRGIFISLFANQYTINTRCIIGYYRAKILDATEESKNSLYGSTCIK